MRLLIAALILMPGLASAQGYFTEIRADLNGDGIIDSANLVENINGGTAALNIILTRADGSEFLAVHAPGIVWVGSAMAGQQPELRLTERGSLQVVSMNEAIGRDRWNQTLTIAYRQGRFKLAGYTYDWWDTLDVSNDGTCDINLLNGRGELLLGEERVKTTFRIGMRAMPVENWDGEIPKVCLDAVNSVSNY